MTSKSDSNFCSRRAFLRRSAVALSSLPALKLVSSLDTSFAQAPATPAQPLDETLPAAVALGYTHDASKVDTAKFPKKKAPDGDKQFCHNCIFYTQGGLKVEGKPGEWGKCTIFPQGLVAANGWCNTWTMKPGAA